MINSLVILLCVFTLSACGGGGAKMETHNSNSTMGQELIDLKKAFDQGILTKKEYTRAKRNITEMYDN